MAKATTATKSDGDYMIEPATATTQTLDTSMDGTQTNVPKVPDTQPADASDQVQAQSQTVQVTQPDHGQITYTPEQQADIQQRIDNAVTKRLSRASRQVVPDERQEQPKPVPDIKPKDATPQELQDTIRKLELGRQFDRSAAVYGHLNDRQRDMLEKLFLDERPQFAAEWIKVQVQELGWVKQEPNPTPVAQPEIVTRNDPKPQPPPGPPASDSGAPTGQSSWKMHNNPELLTKDAITQIYAEMGERKGQQHIRQMAERYYRGRTVTNK